MGHLQPLNIFLRQEIDRMRKVLSIVKATLTDLKLAIDGTIIMNEVRIYFDFGSLYRVCLSNRSV